MPHRQPISVEHVTIRERITPARQATQKVIEQARRTCEQDSQERERRACILATRTRAARASTHRK
jgi:hypothetical protein